MKLFGNDSHRPRVSRDTASFEPVSEAKANRAREQARKKADKARNQAYREYAGSGAPCRGLSGALLGRR